MRAVGTRSVLLAVEGNWIGSSSLSPVLVGGKLGVQSGSFATPGTEPGASCFVDWPARVKILRGHARFDLVFEPADLVCRIRWKTERRECCLSSVSTSWVGFEVGGTVSASIGALRGARTINLVVAGM